VLHGREALLGQRPQLRLLLAPKLALGRRPSDRHPLVLAQGEASSRDPGSSAAAPGGCVGSGRFDLPRRPLLMGTYLSQSMLLGQAPNSQP
jgi:hypothetical protein